MSSIIFDKVEPGDFSFMSNKEWAKTCADGYKAVSKTELWDWLACYEPQPNSGFMFSSHSNLLIISNALEYDNHSGASWGCMMRTLQYIAKHGWDTYVLSTQSPSI